MIAESLAQASAHLAEARRQHFLRDWTQSTDSLQRAIGCLRQAIDGSHHHPVANSQLREALANWQRDLRITLSSHAHAEGWLQQWLQAIQAATGDDPGYNQNGSLPFSAAPRRIAVEG